MHGREIRGIDRTRWNRSGAVFCALSMGSARAFQCSDRERAQDTLAQVLRSGVREAAKENTCSIGQIAPMSSGFDDIDFPRCRVVTTVLNHLTVLIYKL